MTEPGSMTPCQGCDQIMDPIGLALEDFDGVGRWRTADSGAPIDGSGQLVDGTAIDGVEGLRKALLNYSDAFVQTMTEKLLMYASGRSTHYSDIPVVPSFADADGRVESRF